MIALVQSKLGGSASGTVPADNGLSGPQPITTSAVGFDSPTTAGNLVVCVVWANIDTSGTPSLEGGLPVVSGGYSGSFIGHPNAGAGWQFPLSPGLGASHLGFGEMWCIPNAPSLSPSNLFSVTVYNEGSFSGDVNVEFALFEFSGVDASILDLGSSGSASDDQVGGTPDVTFSATTNTDLILTVLSAYPGSNLSAGSGFTLGPDASVATIGQVEYVLNAAPGQTDSGFSGTEPYWGIAALAFGQASGSPTVTVTAVSPSSGSTAGGTAVTITGTDFLSGASVDFGGSAATSVVVVSPTSITCVTPAHAAGAVTVSVTDSDGTGSLANGFTFVAPPTVTVTNVSPVFGPDAGGTAVTITGTDFLSGATVDFGGSAATSVVVASSTSITCVTPAHAAGAVTVSVTDSDGTGSLANAYTYTSTGGGGATNGFTPLYPPIKKQPFGLWGLEATRADSLTSEGSKKSVLDRIDEVTTLIFRFVPLSDLAQWKAFEQYALTGGSFTYRAIPDYPGAASGGTLETSMFQWPGVVDGETGCSVCQLLSMDWTPHFESQGSFSLQLKLKLVEDL